MTKKDTHKKAKLTEQDKEREEIFLQAASKKGQQMFLGEDSRFQSKKEIESYAIGDIDDPVKKHEVYYQGIQKLLIDELPKGAAWKEARNLIYEEKNILINRGNKKNELGVRGSDGRMAYIPDLEMALNIITEWMLERGTPFQLYTKFREKNVEMGYHDQKGKKPSAFQ